MTERRKGRPEVEVRCGDPRSRVAFGKGRLGSARLSFAKLADDNRALEHPRLELHSIRASSMNVIFSGEPSSSGFSMRFIFALLLSEQIQSPTF